MIILLIFVSDSVFYKKVIMMKWLILLLASTVVLSVSAQETFTLDDGTVVTAVPRGYSSALPSEFARMFKGMVVDESGNPIEGVQVSMCHNMIFPQIYGGASNRKGEFSVRLNRGEYIAEFSAVGYEKKRIEMDMMRDVTLDEPIVLSAADGDVPEAGRNTIKYMRQSYQVNFKPDSYRDDCTLADILAVEVPFFDIWDDVPKVLQNPKFEICLNKQTLNVDVSVMKNYFSSVSAADVVSIKIVSASMAMDLPTTVFITTK